MQERSVTQRNRPDRDTAKQIMCRYGMAVCVYVSSIAKAKLFYSGDVQQSLSMISKWNRKSRDSRGAEVIEAKKVPYVVVVAFFSARLSIYMLV